MSQEVVGKRSSSFVGKDGNKVEGTTLFIAKPINPNCGEGVSVEKIFISATKLATMSYVPKVGDRINIYYSRYGKVDTIVPDDIIVD